MRALFLVKDFWQARGCRVKTLAFSLMLSSCLLAFETLGEKDLGTHGALYTIIESPLVASIKKELAKLDPEKMKKQIENSVSSIYTASYYASACIINKEEERENFMYAPQDVIDIDGSYLTRQGERIDVNLPKGIKEDICFIDGADFNQSVRDIKDAEEVGCRLIAISNRDIREYKPLGYKPGKELFPFNVAVWRRFDLTCMPSILHLEGSKIKITQLEQRSEDEEN